MNGIVCAAIEIEVQADSFPQGAEKGIACEGYTQQLKWMTEKLPIPKSSGPQCINSPNGDIVQERNPVVAASTSTAQWNACMSLSRPNLDPCGVYITNPRDRLLIEYNFFTLNQLVYLNSSRSLSIAVLKFYEVVHSSNIALYSIALASSAAHLLARGAITKLEFYEKRQIGLASLRSLIIAPDRKPQESLGSGYQHVSIPNRCQDNTIQASIGLAAIELT